MNAQDSARRAVAKAIADGTLIRGSCQICGEVDAQAHHDDYSKPLVVRWLCRHHHAELHSLLGKTEVLTVQIPTPVFEWLEERAALLELRVDEYVRFLVLNAKE